MGHDIRDRSRCLRPCVECRIGADYSAGANGEGTVPGQRDSATVQRVFRAGVTRPPQKELTAPRASDTFLLSRLRIGIINSFLCGPNTPVLKHRSLFKPRDDSTLPLPPGRDDERGTGELLFLPGLRIEQTNVSIVLNMRPRRMWRFGQRCVPRSCAEHASPRFFTRRSS